MGPEVSGEAEVLTPHDLHGQVGNRLSVSVVTPTFTVTTGAADEVIAPGVDGEFGVLPGHVPFISALKAGVLQVRDAGERKVYAVGPGYLQVSSTGATRVLVQQAIAAADVDLEDARSQKAAAEEALRRAAGGTGEPGTGSEPGAAGSAQAALAWAQAQIDAASAVAHPAR
jgi:F-type H+-transporting ATPase subunit epsilon